MRCQFDVECQVAVEGQTYLEGLPKWFAQVFCPSVLIEPSSAASPVARRAMPPEMRPDCRGAGRLIKYNPFYPLFATGKGGKSRQVHGHNADNRERAPADSAADRHSAAQSRSAVEAAAR